MTESPQSPEPNANVFGLQTAPNLFNKFIWERNQLHRVMAPENYRYPDVAPMYVAFNCAISAWHLIDWVWADATEAQKLELANRYRFELSGGRAAFTTAMCRFLPELAACHDIANGSKHFEITRPKSAVKVEADFAIVIDPRHTGLKPGDYLLNMHVWLADRNMTAQVFFDRILAFWHGLMRDIGMFDNASNLIDQLPVPKPPFNLNSI